MMSKQIENVVVGLADEDAGVGAYDSACHIVLN
jgi:hypothetical protein